MLLSRSSSFDQNKTDAISESRATQASRVQDTSGLAGMSHIDGRARETAELFLYGLPADITGQEVTDLFSEEGRVISTDLSRRNQTNKSARFGFVCYEDPSCAVMACGHIKQVKGKAIQMYISGPVRGRIDAGLEAPSLACGEGINILLTLIYAQPLRDAAITSAIEAINAKAARHRLSSLPAELAGASSSAGGISDERATENKDEQQDSKMSGAVTGTESSIQAAEPLSDSKLASHTCAEHETGEGVQSLLKLINAQPNESAAISAALRLFL